MSEIMSPSTVRVLGIAGSLRARSFNRALIRAAVDLAPDDMEIETFDLLPLPLFNQDLADQGDPPSATALRKAIKDADVVLISTPEYNGGVPGAMKNAIDWGSTGGKPHAWELKPVVVIGITPGTLGTVGAQRHLRDSLSKLNALIMGQPRFHGNHAEKLFDENLNLVDEGTRAFLRTVLKATGDWARRFKDS